MSFKDFTDGVASVVNALAPLIPIGEQALSLAAPGSAAAIDTGVKLFQAAMELEPQAVALVQRITSGEQVTDAEIHQWEEDYEAAYQGLRASIATQKAKLHGGGG